MRRRREEVAMERGVGGGIGGGDGDCVWGEGKGEVGEEGMRGRVDWGGDFGVQGWGERFICGAGTPLCAPRFRKFLYSWNLCLFVDWPELRASYYMSCGGITWHVRRGNGE